MKKTFWRNNPGTTILNVSKENNITADELENNLEIISHYIEENQEYELVIDFLSSGHYDPGNKYGPIDTCYPPEGEDNRTLKEAYLFCDGNKIELPKDLQEKLFNLYYKQIEESEVEFCSTEDEEADHYYDRWKEEQLLKSLQ